MGYNLKWAITQKWATNPVLFWGNHGPTRGLTPEPKIQKMGAFAPLS
jgi:hypothetical protein